MKPIALAAALALFPLATLADHSHDHMGQGDAGITVEDAYARGSNPKAGAAFMVLTNSTDNACTLAGVASDVAEKVELHTHAEVDGVMKMGKIEGGIEIPAMASHKLQRGADHVMLMGLKAPLKDGDKFALTLDFGDCGTQSVEVPVDNQREPEEVAPESQGEAHSH